MGTKIATKSFSRYLAELLYRPRG